jgi:hypothetical protein
MSPVTEYPHAKFSAAQDRDRCQIFQAGARETRNGCEMTTNPTAGNQGHNSTSNAINSLLLTNHS